MTNDYNDRWSRNTERQKDGENKMDKTSRKALKEQYHNRKVIGGVYCIKCSGKTDVWFRATTDIQGAKNRFQFSVSTDSCPEICMMAAWKESGASGFSFEIIEEIEKKETQTEREFYDDVNTLLELWLEKNRNPAP
jgi:hypothetical protein